MNRIDKLIDRLNDPEKYGDAIDEAIAVLEQSQVELAAKDARIAAAEKLLEKWRDKNKVYGQYVCADELAAALAGEQ